MAFEPAESLTAAFVVTWKGRIVAERDGPGIMATTPLGWSIRACATPDRSAHPGGPELEQKAPIPEWQARVTRGARSAPDILHMSSGLRNRAPNDPDFDPEVPTPTTSTSTRAASIPTTTRRRADSSGRRHGRALPHTDPVLASYLVRLAVTKRGERPPLLPAARPLRHAGIHTMAWRRTRTGTS